MSHPSRRILGAVAVSLALAATLSCGSTGPRSEVGYSPPKLELRKGATVTAEVLPGQPHVFPLTIEEGTYVEIYLDRHPNELEAVLLAPGLPLDTAKEAAYALGELASPPPGTVVWEVVTTPGEYHLRIQALEQEPVRYRSTVAALRPATERDWSRHEGLKAYFEARALQDQERYEEALLRFEDARKLFELGDYARGVAAVHGQTGRIRLSRQGWQSAREDFRLALESWKAAGDESSVAGSLVNLADLERRAGESSKAEAYIVDAIAVARQAQSRAVEATALGQYCNICVQAGRNERGIEICNQALELRRRLGAPGEMYGPLVNLGILHRYKGETESAHAYFLQAQDLLQKYPNRLGEATVRNELATIYGLEGEYLEALTQYQKAFEEYEILGMTSYAGTALFNMGTTYRRLGDLERTLQFYRQALDLLEQSGERFARIHVLLGIGWVHVQNEDLEEAAAVLAQAEEIAREADNPDLLAAALERWGQLHLAAGRPGEAARSLEQAMALYRAGGSRWREAPVLAQLARARAAEGDVDRALELLFQAATLYEDIGRRSGVAESYHQIATLERNRGRLDEARMAAEQAIGVAEALRPQVGSDEFRTLFSATTRPFYELYVDILMEQHARAPGSGHDTEALRESERARARSLLEILPESDLDFGEDVAEELLAERAAIQHRLNTKETERRVLTDKGDADAGHLFRLKLDLEGLLTELQEIERQIRAASPRYAALTRPEPVSVGEIQRALLDPETALLEYLLGEERSFLWVVTSGGFRSFELPSRLEIEERARCVHWLITAFGTTPAPDALGADGARCLGEDHPAYVAAPSGSHVLKTRSHRRKTIRRAYDRVALELSNMVLGPPARDQLLPFRLAVVSDGALEYVPFAALPSPGAGGAPLALEHELVRLPSASVLAFQRAQAPSTSRPEKELAIVADPVYNRTDPRLVRGGARVPQETPGSTPGPTDGSSFQILPRLDFSGREAKAISGFTPAPRTLLLHGFDAERGSVTQGALSGYRYVHFATHGVIDTEYPRLSSLVLSLLKKDGTYDPGGHLRLHDIYGLDLDGTDLVVLSACETALGREVRGEGLVGLTRGFLYAGAERVVASLWRVQDRATADLMERFYRGLLHEDRSPADALRQAQLDTMQAGDGAHAFPYYWAGFVLQGEWR